MYVLRRLADKFILQPTNHALPTEGKSRRVVRVGKHEVEVWVQRTRGCSTRDDSDADLFILKFPGTGGRAERASEHPADRWPSLAAEVWAVNPPGYGGSGGRASLRTLAPTAEAVFAAIQESAAGRPVIVTGNSLGTVTALFVAARFPIHGLLLRNPPPVREIIIGRHGWWNLGIGARLLSFAIPLELCSISNAKSTAVPALFISSAKDRTVPPRFQQQVIDAHAGPNRVMVLPNADHRTPLAEEEKPHYAEHLDWLLKQVLQQCKNRIGAREPGALPG